MAARLPLILIGFFLFIVIPALVDFFGEWVWFGEMGYRQIFITSLTTKILLGAAVFVGTLILLGGNLRFALQELKKPFSVGTLSPETPPLVLDKKSLRTIVTGVAGLVALFMALFASGQWLTFLQYQHATTFGTVDPLLGRDVGFYVFELPFLDFLRYMLLAITVLSLIGCSAIYLIAGALGYQQ